MLNSLNQLNIGIKNKSVLVRVDFDVPLSSFGRVGEYQDWRIRSAIPTIDKLISNSAKKIILLGHLDRPGGRVRKDLMLKPVVKHLGEVLKTSFSVLKNPVGVLSISEKEASILGPLISPVYWTRLKNTEVFILENIRFHPGEEANDPKLASALASLADIFINESFASSHRPHCSIVGLPRLLPSLAGIKLAEEVKHLTKIKKSPKHPFVLIIGGAKLKTKIPTLKSLLPIADQIVVGGIIANTMLAAKGLALGRSIYDPQIARSLKNVTLADTKIHLPVDVVTASDLKATRPSSIKPVGRLQNHELILDIGPDTRRLFGEVIGCANTILWNGPLGYSENPVFRRGSRAVAQAIIDNQECFSLIGGQDTITLLQHLGVLGEFSYVSGGGGAMLEFFAKGSLVGLEALGYSID